MVMYSRIPSAELKAGQTVTWQSLAARKSVKDFDLGGSASDRAKASKAPYEVVYEDENILAYIKPAGMVFASPQAAGKDVVHGHEAVDDQSAAQMRVHSICQPH